MQLSVLLLLFILGTVIGSFINAMQYRLAKGKAILANRSYCDSCGRVLLWYELIPLVGYVMFACQCRQCKVAVPVVYPLLEAVLGILFAYAAFIHFPDWTLIFRDCLAISVLAFLFVYDAKYGLLPDVVTLPAMVMFFAINLFLGVSWQSLLLAAGIGAGFFALQYLVSRGKWIGGGDIRFGALLGALLGFPNIIVGLFASYVLGSVVVLFLLLSGKKKFGQTIPFGTFLALGGLLALWRGDEIINWYLSLL